MIDKSPNQWTQDANITGPDMEAMKSPVYRQRAVTPIESHDIFEPAFGSGDEGDGFGLGGGISADTLELDIIVMGALTTATFYVET